MKIGILTWHQYHNFGSALQAAALRITLTSMGYDAKVINYLHSPGIGEYAKKIRCIIGKISSLLNTPALYRFRYAFLRFQNDYMHLTPCVLKDDLTAFSRQFDCLICGSDQIWAPNVLDQSYLLDFCEGKRIRKISYAASIGLPIIPDDLVPIYQKNLFDFYRVSVREESGRELLSKATGIKAAVVLDPTLLLSCDQYIKMEQRLPIGTKPYIFCYFLNKDHNYMERVKQYASQKGIRILGVSTNQNDKTWMDVFGAEVGPEEFLFLIHHADTVFTDSYHGTIFSLLYHKCFYTFERFSENDSINQNSRIYQLDKLFGIGKHIIKQDQEIINNPYLNYKEFESNLLDARKKSLDFITEALK